MSETPDKAPSEGAFGAPPGASQWSPPQPQPQPAAPPHPQQTYPQQTYPQQTYPQQTYPQQTYPQQTYPQQGQQPWQPTYQGQPYPQPPQGYPGYAPPQGQAYQQGYAGYARPASPFPTSTLILLIVSVVALIATAIIGIPSAVLAALAWQRNAQDPAVCRKRTTTGWIVLAVNVAIAIPLLIWFYTWALSNR